MKMIILMMLMLLAALAAYAAAGDRTPAFAAATEAAFGAVPSESKKNEALMCCSDCGCGGEGQPAISEDAASAGVTSEMLGRSVVSEGDSARLAEVMRKAARGEDITVAVLGGSITAGSSVSEQRLCYGSRVFDWWKQSFPKSKVSFYNMGIGATGSLIGVHRLANDILSREPDFVIVEFAVNDSENDGESYECILRRLLSQKKNTAVIMLFMTDQFGWNVQEQEIPVGREYGIPMISYHDAVWPDLAAGKLAWTDISPDGIHPNDRGHAIAASLVCAYLDGVKERLSALPSEIPPLPPVLVGDRYMDAQLYAGDVYKPDSLGSWEYFDDFNFYHLCSIWKSTGTGESLVFTVNAKCINLLYYKSTEAGAAVADVSVDGGEPVKVDSFFENGWGNHLTSAKVFESDRKETHTLSISNTGGVFILAGLMLA